MRKNKRKADRIALELPKEMNDWIQRRANQAFINKSAVIRQLIAQAMITNQ